MKNHIKKIVIIGPESTGKTTLCKKLASHFNTIWVEEYARKFLTENPQPYSAEDLDTIALGQIALEKNAIEHIQKEKTNPLLFLDTDMQVMKVWSEFVFNQCSPLILNHLASSYCDLYLLCEPDIAWVQDDLREHQESETRYKIYHHYRESMLNQSAPWANINGEYGLRFEKAVAAVQKLLNEL